MPTTRKPLEHSRRVCVEGHALHIMGDIVAIALLLLSRAIDILCEQDAGILQSTNASLNSTENSLHNKRPTRL